METQSTVTDRLNRLDCLHSIIGDYNQKLKEMERIEFPTIIQPQRYIKPLQNDFLTTIDRKFGKNEKAKLETQTGNLETIRQRLEEIQKKRKNRQNQKIALEMHTNIKQAFQKRGGELINQIQTKRDELKKIDSDLYSNYDKITTLKYSKFTPNYMKSSIDTLIEQINTLTSTIEDTFLLQAPTAKYLDAL